MSKLVKSIKDALLACGAHSGMSISFHHHLRNGDWVLNLVMEAIADMGLRDITLNASSLFDVHTPLIKHIENGVVKKIYTDYMSAGIGEFISAGGMKEPVVFMTHGTRPTLIAEGKTPIDIAFVAASCADSEGNCTGRMGQSAFGSMGYAFADAEYAAKTVVVTDFLCEKAENPSITAQHTDFVVKVDAIGDPKGIISGTTTVTRDPVGLVMARDAADVIRYSGLLKDGFCFQTGAGGASLAAAKFLMSIMQEEHIKGKFALGGITSYMVEMLRAGCFENLYDVQCFDLAAAQSLRDDPRHKEISAFEYASPKNENAYTNFLDVVILGATEIDTDFNVNVHTSSTGVIIGGAGGHTDTAAGAKLTMVVAPLFRARQPLIGSRVTCVSTPGKDVDVLVTQYGIAVNPNAAPLEERLRAAHLPIVPIEELKAIGDGICGVPQPVYHTDRVVAQILDRRGEVSDVIYGK